LVAVVVVENVVYAPSWSWEVERVTEAAPNQLPDNLAPIARAWIEAVNSRL